MVYLWDQTRSLCYGMSWVHVLSMSFLYTVTQNPSHIRKLPHLSCTLSTGDLRIPTTPPLYPPHASGQDWYQIIKIQTSPTQQVRYESERQVTPFTLQKHAHPAPWSTLRTLVSRWKMRERGEREGEKREREREKEREEREREGASDGIIYII